MYPQDQTYLKINSVVTPTAQSQPVMAEHVTLSCSQHRADPARIPREKTQTLFCVRARKKNLHAQSL